VFYFEPNDGIIQDTPFKSERYVYRLPDEFRARVETEVKTRTEVGPNGFQYYIDFLWLLGKKDTKWDQKV